MKERIIMRTTHCWIELDKEALLNNYQFFCDRIGKSKIAPVLKANAYGHGLSEVYHILAPYKPSWLCVNYLYEGEKLRQWGYDGRILVLGPIVSLEEIELAGSLEIELVIGNEEMLALWLEASSQPCIHIKFDTGLSRQGFAAEKALIIAGQLVPHRLKITGVLTHFANVEDALENDFAQRQISLLKAAKEAFVEKKLQVKCHASSSASSLLYEQDYFDLCRIGISLYGLCPSKLTLPSYQDAFGHVANLKPVLSWKTKIAQVRPLLGGEYVGYGCTFKAPGPMKIAVLSVGYFEGYPRIAANHQSYVLVKGVKCPIIGRICMNMTIVDVSKVSTVAVGTTATLIGSEKKETIDAQDLGDWSKTINYEIVTRLNSSIPRQIN